jgi:hypothetical protein
MDVNEELPADMALDEFNPEDLEASLAAELGGGSRSSGHLVPRARPGPARWRRARPTGLPRVHPRPRPRRGAGLRGPRPGSRPPARRRAACATPPASPARRMPPAAPERRALHHPPIAVAEILASYRLDSATLATALLHDVAEDTEHALPEIERRFGPRWRGWWTASPSCRASRCRASAPSRREPPQAPPGAVRGPARPPR